MDFSLLDANGGQGAFKGVALALEGRGRRCVGQTCAFGACTHPHTLHPTLRPTPPPPGWDLAVKLLRPKNQFNRGRLSAGEALRHPFLLLPA